LFEQKTTIIIGAGASADFGIPLGNSLFSQIKDDAFWIAADNRNLHHPEGDSKRQTLVNLIIHLNKNQIYDLGEILEQACNFRDRCGNFLYASIDRFMRENPSCAEFSKILISLNLMQALYSRVGDSPRWIRQENHLNISTGKPRNWIAAFAAHVRDGLDDPEEFHQHYKNFPLRIISFNYEDIFEQAFEYFLRTGELYSDFTLAPSIHIHHCYGKMPSLPKISSDYYSLIIENSKSIKTIFEAEDPIPDEYGKRIFLDDAVYFLGFSCDKENLRFLGLNTPEPKSIYVHSFNGDNRMKNILKSSGVINIASGSPNKSKSICEFIDVDGVFEENFIPRTLRRQETFKYGQKTSD